MKRLILMRHAKSSWDSPHLSDHDRPLNSRGEKSAILLGNWLLENDIIPDQAIISSSVRTEQTFAGLELETPLTLKDSLYHAHPQALLDTLHEADQQAETIIIIAHNPGIASFAERLLDELPSNQAFYRYPTGATTVITWDIENWMDIDWRIGNVSHFITPRELKS